MNNSDKVCVRLRFAACLIFGVVWLLRPSILLGQCDIQEREKLSPIPQGAGDQFGNAIAINEEVCVVGDFMDLQLPLGRPGSASIFIRPNGAWYLTQFLIPADAQTGDEFGFSVAMSGQTVMIGADRDSHAGGASAGSVYVYQRSGNSWIQQVKLTASDANGSEFFGWSVALSGDTAVIGAPGEDTSTITNIGAAYVYVRNAGVWTQQAKLVTPTLVAFNALGQAAALSGNTAVVSCLGDDPFGFSNAGSVYVFNRTGNVWSMGTRLVASDAAADDSFGYSLAMSGDMIVIGVPRDDHSGFSNAGSVYIFTNSGGWIQQAKLTASDAAADDEFGTSVAIAGENILVGAPLDDHADGANSGAVYFFTRPPGGWVNMTESAKLVSFETYVGDSFGYSVAAYGDVVAVGAILDDFPLLVNAGSIQMYDLGCMPDCCQGDFDGNSIVTEADIPGMVAVLLAGAVCGPAPSCCIGDLNLDGFVNGGDVPAFIEEMFAGITCDD